MPHPGTPVVRGHLRLVPDPPRRAAFRLAAMLRAPAAALATAWASAMAWRAAAFSGLPRAWRHFPARRRQPSPPQVSQQEARVIPFQPRREALPR